MKVRDLITGEVFMVADVRCLFTHPSANTIYILEDGREFTNGEFWAKFVQVPYLLSENEE